MNLSFLCTDSPLLYTVLDELSDISNVLDTFNINECEC